MQSLVYIVHSHPSNVREGTMFKTLDEAHAFAKGYGQHGACISEMIFSYATTNLIEDTRKEEA